MPDKISCKIPNISNILRRSNELNHISDSPRLDVEVILGHVLSKNRSYLYTWPNEYLSTLQYRQFNEFFDQRLSGIPVAHILGYREFWSLPLKVSAKTLIPRPETELLVEIALSLPLDNDISALDLGTGTGAIALALATEKKLWNIKAIDNELGALEIAEQNRKSLLLDNVKIQKSNWFSELKGNFFDLIVSNPPYIKPNDPHLQRGDVRFEPVSALISENLGLSDIRLIVSCAKNQLNSGGWLAIEHGYDQGSIVRQLMTNNGYDEVETFRDLSCLDRVTICKNPT
jgi:release factor glutamine methyltransferase